MNNKPTYKTAAELGIKQWEHDGMVALIGPLGRNELEFDMKEYTCGTAHCIGGWLWLLAAKDWEDSSHCTNNGLSRLYLPFGKAWGATGSQAARAIVNFLVTGDPSWDAVMATP